MDLDDFFGNCKTARNLVPHPARNEFEHLDYAGRQLQLR